jgi:hypothetical protein
MNAWMLFGLLTCAMGTAACSGQQEETPKERVAKKTWKKVSGEELKLAIKVAGTMMRKPKDAKKALERADMSREAFDQLIYRIAADPVASEKYVTSLEKMK